MAGTDETFWKSKINYSLLSFSFPPPGNACCLMEFKFGEYLQSNIEHVYLYMSAVQKKY